VKAPLNAPWHDELSCEQSPTHTAQYNCDMNSPNRPRIALIAAVAKNGVIGRNGALPWHLSDDLKHFKALTTGKRIVMGRRTWESFPKPLPNREHVVVTSRELNVPLGVIVVRSLDDALVLANATDPVFVIGGSAMYREALAIVDDLYLTEIEADVDGDTHFPSWPRAQFREASRVVNSGTLNGDNAVVRFDFVHYTRISSDGNLHGE
jgi:dihydrofolate reductase